MLRDLSPRKVKKKIGGKGEAIAVSTRIGTDSQITGDGILVLTLLLVARRERTSSGVREFRALSPKWVVNFERTDL